MARDKQGGEGAGTPTWVSLGQAAADTGVSISALRKWYREEVIRSKMAPGRNGEQRFVVLEDVRERAARFARVRTPADDYTAPTSDDRRAPEKAESRAVIEYLEQRVEELTVALATARAELAKTSHQRTG